ncbi:MAG: CHASE2 domain-containing serine/threonine-protein kinase [Gammaproteobacteria bacterium]
MDKTFWKSDWFVGASLSFVFLVAWWWGSTTLERLERVAYDSGVRLASGDPGDRVAVVAIDDKSIQNIGRWPWPRNIHAAMIERLRQAGAKVIGATIFYSEPEVAAGLEWIERFRGETESIAGQGADVGGLVKLYDEAEKALDNDAILAHSMEQAGDVVLGMQFIPGIPIGNPDEELPDYITANAIADDNISDPSGLFPLPTQTIHATPPVPTLGHVARGIGHLINPLDIDGGIRFEPLVIEYFGQFYPSESLLIAAAYHNLKASDIKVSLGESVHLGNLEIRTDDYLNINTFFYGERDGGRPPFDVYSFDDVRQGSVPMENFKDKIVLIGATAFGVGSTLYTPIGDLGGPVLVMAHTVASILNEDFFIAPSWATLAEFFVILLVAAYLTALLPRLNAGPAAIISVVLFLALIVTELALMTSQAIWIKLVAASVLLGVGHMLLTTKRFLVTEASKRRVDVESALSNKQLALQFQQQGQLDMAFEYFRRCPVDESTLEAIYVLAGDYERKRQFNKAASAYEYIASKNPEFRDIKAKVNRARQLNDTVVIGGSAASSAASTMLLDGSISKPMLGRYEVEKELGKGAMGVVYLGKDPKINRTVAIKTMALSQEFEADELDAVKERFFREAETAGRLDHPNIVTIYDAGEEHDLAYIAMEFLQGHDLARYTKPDALLPTATVMGVIFKSAMALDYAHKHNVVHRDIKPANIMYEPQSKQVKLTDFGIARITDSSKTKTGMVLGTPSYMSPEQLSGKKVDGRSDLFSLGVMFYQMLTGRLPFQGDSMATLMYKIANEAHTEVAQLRPDLAKQRPCISAIINKALEKDPEQRYQTGAEMARDIQRCAKQSQASEG